MIFAIHREWKTGLVETLSATSFFTAEVSYPMKG
jgi:hypothetical protein